MQTLFKERILPDLSKNIVCGNSLIGTDISSGGLFETDDERKINAMNFEDRFPEIMKNGGFDAIVGNPPYILLQMLETKLFFNYCLNKFKSAKYKIDTYQLFIEKAVNLLKNKGVFSYIIPNTFLKNIHSEPIRYFILKKTFITEIVLFYYRVFQKASVDNCILVLKKSSHNENTIIKEVKKEFSPTIIRELKQDSFMNNKRLDFNISLSNVDAILIEKIKNNNDELRKYCGAYFGIQTFDRKTYVNEKILDRNYKPVIDGFNIERYYMIDPIEYVNFTNNAIKSGGNPKIYEQDRICIRQIGKTPICTYVIKGVYTLNTIYNVYKLDNQISLKFFLGIMNSLITKYYWLKINSDEKETFPKVKKDAILSIPIKSIDLLNPTEKAQHDKMVNYVDQMLDTKKKLAQANTDKDKNFYEGKYSTLDRQIDHLVYELYGLTEEEIKIVEGR